MFALKLFLLLQILTFFVLKVSHTMDDARIQLNCEEPSLSFWEKCTLWLGKTEESKVCLSREEIVQNALRTLLRSLLALLLAEMVRTIGLYYLLGEGHVEIFLPKENFRSGEVADWAFILRQNPNFVIYANRGDCPDEYLFRTVNMLTTTTVTYNVHTGRVHSWVRPRLFVY